MIVLADVHNVVSQYGYSAERAKYEHVSLFENDLADSDILDLSNSWRNDWKASLHASFEKASALFLVTSPYHDGASVFGITEGPLNSGQIWLLQTMTFSREAEVYHGKAWPLKAVAMTKGVVEVFGKSHNPIFNFKSRTQVRSIKWLEMCGFQFFHRTDVETDMVFFGQGTDLEIFVGHQQLWTSYLGKNF